MPRMTVETFGSPEPKNHRYKVLATGEAGSALTHPNPTRKVSIGPALNVVVVDLCMDETGEVRTFRKDCLAELADASE